MKRIIGIILTAMFVLGLAATAFAGVDLGGDARVRGVWRDNYNLDDDVDADARYYDTRVRLKATADVGGGVKVVTRFKLVDGKFDGTSNTQGGVNVDYAYLVAPIGPATITAGLQVAGWGNKLLSHDDRKDRIKITFSAGGTTFGVFTDKAVELVAGDNDGDTDAYGGLVITNMGDVKGGILVILVKDDTSGDDGIVGSIFINGDVGVGLAAEVIYKGGDLYEGADGDPGMAAMVAISKAMDAVGVSGTLMYATNGITADNDFNPSIFIGTAQPTAYESLNATDGDSTLGATVKVSFKASDVIGAYGGAAYVSKDAAAGDSSYITIEGGVSIALAKGATWYLDAGILMPDDMSASDDSALAFHQKLQIDF